MKRRLSKILGVGLTLALLFSLLLTAAPVSADVSSASVSLSDEEISATSDYTVTFAVTDALDTVGLVTTGTSTAAWSTLHAQSGTYSAKLYTTYETADYAGVEITPTVAVMIADLATIATTNFEYWLDTGAFRGPLLELRFMSADSTDPDGAGHVDITVDTAELVFTTNTNMTETVTTGSHTIFFGNDADGTAFSGSANLGAVAAAIDAASAYTLAEVNAWELVRIHVDLGWAGGYLAADVSTAYIDDVNIDGTLYALEEGDTVGTITIVFPEDFDITAITNTLTDDDVTVGASSGIGTTASAATEAASVISTTTNDDDTLTIKVPNDIGAGATVQVVIGQTHPVVNAATPGDDYTLEVSTSVETDAVTSEAYTLNPPDILVPAGVARVFNPSGIEFQPRTGDNAINLAIDAAGDDWLIVIGEGRYPTVINDTGGWDGLTIRGAAGADVIIAANMTVNSGVSATTEATFTLENVTIDGTLTLGVNADSAVITDCTFEGGQNSLVIATGCDTPDIIDCSFTVEDGDTAITLNDEADITGSSFTLVDGATAINVAAAADGGTVVDCTFTGGTGDGIILAGDTDVTDCTFDGLDWALQIVGGTQVISGNTIQACDEIAIDINGAVDVQITGNTITDNNEDVLLDVAVAVDAALVQMMFNDILDNAGDADGLLINNNDTTADLNCINNWWGDPDGPGAAAFSDDVLSAPFLTASVGDTGVLGTNVAVGTLWDERTTAGVTLRAAGGIMEIVGAAQYADNPGTAVDGTALAFRDVCVIDTDNDVTEVTIRLYLAAGITTDTEAWVWGAARGEWLECSNYAPNLFGGFVVITVTDSTIPTIEDLEELPFALVTGEAAALTTPGIVMPDIGAEDVSLRPTLVWEGVAAADAYDVWLADNPDFTTATTQRVTTTFWATPEDLQYDTTYWWRVRAVTLLPLALGDWSESVFITMAEPVEPTPPVVVEEAPPAPEIIIEQPDLIVTVPAATPITPAWIYVIIAVGAVLVIALLVLIVRTRRVA